MVAALHLMGPGWSKLVPRMAPRMVPSFGATRTPDGKGDGKLSADQQTAFPSHPGYVELHQSCFTLLKQRLHPHIVAEIFSKVLYSKQENLLKVRCEGAHKQEHSPSSSLPSSPSSSRPCSPRVEHELLHMTIQKSEKDTLIDRFREELAERLGTRPVSPSRGMTQAAPPGWCQATSQAGMAYIRTMRRWFNEHNMRRQKKVRSFLFYTTIS